MMPVKISAGQLPLSLTLTDFALRYLVQAFPSRMSCAHDFLIGYSLNLCLFQAINNGMSVS